MLAMRSEIAGGLVIGFAPPRLQCPRNADLGDNNKLLLGQLSF
jgi:hypothetical protein